MARIDKHKNIFYFYRGPISKREDDQEAGKRRQLENNITKALVNVLDPGNLKANISGTKMDFLANAFFAQILGCDSQLLGPLRRVELQKFYSEKGTNENNRIPDAVFTFEHKIIGIESKYTAEVDFEQLKGQLKHLQKQDSNAVLVVLAPKLGIGKKNITQENILFFSWEKVHDFFDANKKSKELTDKMTFLRQQFSEYLRLMHMTERFTKYDFEEVADIEMDNTRPEKELRNKFDVFVDLVTSELNKKTVHKLRLTKLKTDKNFWKTMAHDATNASDTKDKPHFTVHLIRDGIDLLCTTEGRGMPKKIAEALGAKMLEEEPESFWENKPASQFWDKINSMANQSEQFDIRFNVVRHHGQAGEEPVFNMIFELKNKASPTYHPATIVARKKYLAEVLKKLYDITLGKAGEPYYYFRISCLVNRRMIEEKKTIEKQVNYFVEKVEPIIDMYNFFQGLLEKE